MAFGIAVPNATQAVLLQQGQLEESEQEYRLALRPPGGEVNPWAYLGLARVLARRGRWAESLTCLETSAQSPATRRASATLLAEVHANLGDNEASRRDLVRDTSLPADLAEPNPFFEELLRAEAGLEVTLNRGKALLGQGKPGEALALYARATRDYPSSEEAWRMLGAARLRQGDLAGAEEACRAAARLAPESLECQVMLGQVQFRREEVAAAAATFRRVLALKPDCAEAADRLAHCLVRQGGRAGAIQVLETALRHLPFHAGLHRELAALLAQEGREAEAQEHRRLAHQLGGGSPPQPAKND